MVISPFIRLALRRDKRRIPKINRKIWPREGIKEEYQREIYRYEQSAI